MKKAKREAFVLAVLVALLLGSFMGCGGGNGNPPPPPTTYTLAVSKTGTGSGTVTDNAGKISCGASCSASYNNGTSVTLTATPATGSLFTGWSGGCTGTATTCAITMNQGRSATAKFDQVVLTVTPATASVITGGTQQFMPKDQNGNVVDVNWFVNDIMSGNATVGTIDISGLYTAPGAVPNPATVTVKACSRADSTKCGTAAVTIAAPPEKIAFWRYIDNLSGMVSEEIWSINPDGTELRQLTSTPGYQNLEPVFSPDGGEIAFVTNRNSILAIYIMKADGSEQTWLNTGDSSTWPSWSPDGKKIAFIYASGDEIGVAVIDLETGNVQKLTRENCGGGGCKTPGHPTWSPDGTKIAFDSPRSGGQWDIYVMKADGTKVTNITNTVSVNELGPSWSPDGNLIAFMSNTVGHWEIYTMRLDGSDTRKLTTTPTGGNPQEGAADPAWSPDSTEVIFARYTSDSPPAMILYTVLADGTEAEQPLPNSPDICRYPTWARIR